MIKVKHNFDSSKFKWLWSKYVIDGNDKKHCTNCLKGKYSKKFSKHNENFNNDNIIVFDEENNFKAIYICGVRNKGYSQKKNYPHNIHAAIIPKEGAKDTWEFEGWRLEVENGVFSHIPSIEELPLKYRSLPDEFITCRIYRWAIGYFYSNKGEDNMENKAFKIDREKYMLDSIGVENLHPIYKKTCEYLMDKINVPKGFIGVDVPLSMYGFSSDEKIDIVVYKISDEYNKESEVLSPIICVKCLPAGTEITEEMFDKYYRVDNDIISKYLFISNGNKVEVSKFWEEYDSYTWMTEVEPYEEMDFYL